MKAISILVLLALAAVASATQVAATPYDSVYAWLYNILLTGMTVYTYTACLAGTHLVSFLWGDGGYSFYYCIMTSGHMGGDRAFKAEA